MAELEVVVILLVENPSINVLTGKKPLLVPLHWSKEEVTKHEILGKLSKSDKVILEL